MEKKSGLEKLTESVLRDVAKGAGCFNPNGCNKEKRKCSNNYCDKYKWIVDRAKHYAEKTGKNYKEFLDIWEGNRTYWYVNYYQECNFPKLNSEKVIFYENWISELKRRFGEDAKKWEFVCPVCGNVQTIQDFIDLKIENPEDEVYYNCIGRYTKDKGCDWTLGGLLKIHKLSVLKGCRIIHVFEMNEI